LYDWQYTDVGPLHNKAHFTNQRRFWANTDSEELFNSNMANTATRTLLVNHGWLETSIEYRYNHQGFRDEDFDDRPCVLALGCSFTFGIALPEHQIWPRLLSQALGIHVWNLGAPGSGIQTVFRVLDYYLDKLAPKAVYVLIPPKARLEWADIHGVYRRALPNEFNESDRFLRDWMAQESNHDHQDRVHKLAIRQLCNDKDIPVYLVESIQSIIDPGLARDLQHPGLRFQQVITQQFLEATQND